MNNSKLVPRPLIDINFVERYNEMNKSKYKFFMSAFSSHAFMVKAENQNLFGFGNNNYYQLGLGNNEYKIAPTEVNYFKRSTIKTVKLGREFSVFLTSDNQTFVCGDNTFGQLCLGDTEIRKKPVLLELVNNKDSKKIEIYRFSCGYEHVHFVTTKFQVFGAGRNNRGALGCGDFKHKSSPIDITDKFPSFEQIFDVQSGLCFSIFLSKTGRIFSCGYNSNGQLGIGNFENQNTPVEIMYFHNIPKRISKIRCGNSHTVILAHNKAYSFGCGGDYRLGTGKLQDSSKPRKIKGRFKNIYCGGYHNVFINKNNEVFSFGNSQSGRLGGKQFKSVKEPTLVKEYPTIGENDEICSGMWNTYIIGKNDVKGCGFREYLLSKKENDCYEFIYLMKVKLQECMDKKKNEEEEEEEEGKKQVEKKEIGEKEEIKDSYKNLKLGCLGTPEKKKSKKKKTTDEKKPITPREKVTVKLKICTKPQKRKSLDGRYRGKSETPKFRSRSIYKQTSFTLNRLHSPLRSGGYMNDLKLTGYENLEELREIIKRLKDDKTGLLEERSRNFEYNKKLKVEKDEIKRKFEEEKKRHQKLIMEHERIKKEFANTTTSLKEKERNWNEEREFILKEISKKNEEINSLREKLGEHTINIMDKIIDENKIIE